jgi:hypothetical protein
MVERLSKIPKINTIPEQAPYFVVVRGLIVGIYSTFEQVKRVKGHQKGGIYKKFQNREEAIAWYQQGISIPYLIDPNAIEIHYDVTQDRDWYASVSIVFPHKEYPDKCVNASTEAFDLDFKIMLKIFDTVPHEIPLLIITDSKRIAYGYNYNMRAFPNHDLGPCEPLDLWEQLLGVIRSRPTYTAIDWRDDGNKARRAVDECCMTQYHARVPDWIIMRQQQRMSWAFCAKIYGLPLDLRRKIGNMITGCFAPDFVW